jgi:iron complex transport system substrate-binding protein
VKTLERRVETMQDNEPRAVRRRVALWGVALALVLLSGACGGAGGSGEGGKTVDADAAGTISVTDSSGAQVEVNGVPERIVCTTENCIDILSQLSVMPVAVLQDNVEMARDPRYFGEAAEDLQTIGGSWFEPSVEDVIAAEPDLVIGFSGAQDVLIEPLEGVAPLFMCAPYDYEGAIREVEAVGEILGREEAAAESVREFREKLEDYAERSPGDVSAVIMFGSDTNFGITNEENEVGSVLSEVTDYPWPAPPGTGPEPDDWAGPSNLEAVLEKDPDVIFIETLSYGDPTIAPLSEQLAANPLWSELKAVREGRVYEIEDSLIWHQGGGLRSYGIALDQAMSMLYPEIFSGG